MDILGGSQLSNNSTFTTFVLKVVALIFVLYIYNISKASIAFFLGDKSSRTKDALTLNLFKNIEPVGFILFLAMNCGWAKPLNISFLHMKDKKKSAYFVYILPNVIIFLISILLVSTLGFVSSFMPISATIHYYSFVSQFMYYTCFYIILNLLPVAPFDCYHILTKNGKPNTRMYLSNNEKIFQMVFIFILFFGILNVLVSPFVSFVANLILGLAV